MTILIACLIITLGVTDVWLTNKIIDAGGREANPLMAWLQSVVPFSWEFVKIIVHVMVAIAVLTYPAFIYGGVLFATAYIGVCGWNVHILKRINP